MSFIPRVTCRRCGRQYSGLRGRCPYCGTRRVKQSERVPAASASTDPGSQAGQRAASNTRWQLIFGGILLVAVILAVVVLVSISLNGSTADPQTTFPSVPPSDSAPVYTPPVLTPSPTPPPAVESVTIWYDGAPASDAGYVMNPVWNGPGETLTISVVVYPQTLTNLSEAIEWTSSDESVITVTPDANNPSICTLTQVGNGNCTITCTVYGVSDTLPMIGDNMS